MLMTSSTSSAKVPDPCALDPGGALLFGRNRLCVRGLAGGFLKPELDDRVYRAYYREYEDGGLPPNGKPGPVHRTAATCSKALLFCCSSDTLTQHIQRGGGERKCVLRAGMQSAV